VSLYPLTKHSKKGAGYHDAVGTLRRSEVIERPTTIDGVFTFDLAYDGRE
jgi:NTE family protein